CLFCFSSRRRHTRSTRDWSSDVCSSDLVGHRLLISRILTGQFPNYEAVLPRDNNKNVVIERAELSDAVRRVSQLADQRSHAVKLDRKSTRLNSSHEWISYAVFCLKKKNH